MEFQESHVLITDVIKGLGEDSKVDHDILKFGNS